jgi:hypothetical protein
MSRGDFGSRSNPGGGSRPSKADWRRGAGAATPGVRPAMGKKPGWGSRPDQAYQTAKRWYRVKVATWVILFLVMVGIFIWEVSRRPQRTPFLALAVTAYGSAGTPAASSLIPPNAWAAEDVENFRALDQREEILQYVRCEYAPGEIKEKGFRQLREEIHKLRGGRKTSVIVYLSVHGAVNRSGEPCLLLPGFSAYDTDQWLRLHDLLQYLFYDDSPERLPEHKLLILDCNRMDMNWRLGMLYNSFAEGLEAVSKDARIPGLVILNSTRPGQVGWTSPDRLMGSVFAHFLWRGLRGEADLNGDRRVSLQEAYQYVRRQVRQWVVEHRADVQEPMLIPDNAEIEALLPAKSGAASPPAAGDAAYSQYLAWEKTAAEQVDQLWRTHAELSEKNPYRTGPVAWEEFQHKLLKLESLLTAGPAYVEDFQQTKRRLDALAAELAAPDAVIAALPADSLPLARCFGKAAGSAAPPGSLFAAWKSHKLPPGTSYPYPALAGEAWKQAGQGAAFDAYPDLVRFVDELQPRSPAGSATIEIHFLRMLGSYVDPRVAQQHGALIRQAVAARDAAERSAAPDDERAHYWIQALVNQADRQRRQAEDKLFVGRPEELDEAQAIYEKLCPAAGSNGAAGSSGAAGSNGAADSGGAGGTYGEAMARAHSIALAMALRDRAWSHIPYWAEWLLARLHSDEPEQVDGLRALIAATHELGSELDAALARGDWPPPPSLEQSRQRVKEKFDALQTSFAGECDRLWRTAGDDPKTLQAISTLLAVPLVTGPMRLRLRSTYQEIAGRETETKTAAAGADASLTAIQVAAYLGRSSLRGEHPAVAILDRGQLGAAGAAGLGKPESSVVRAAESEASAQANLLRMQATGQQVRDRLRGLYGEMDKMLEETKTLLLRKGDATPEEVRAGRSRADRLLRAAAPLCDTDVKGWDEVSGEPARQLRRLDVHYLLLWHCYRTLEDFWGPRPGGNEGASYFAATAGAELSAAGDLLGGIPANLQYAKGGEKVLLPARLEALASAAENGIRTVSKDLFIDNEEELARGQFTTTLVEGLPPGEAAVYVVDQSDSTPGGQTVPLWIPEQQQNVELRRLPLPIQPGARTRDDPYRVRSNDPHLERKQLLATALYRGHLYPQAFRVQKSGGLDVLYQPVPYQNPVVTVKGDETLRTSVIFIIDYSGSMTEAVPPPVDNPNAVPGKRYEVARTALKEILKRLADQPGAPYRVGIMAYAHRRGWDDDNIHVVKHNPKDPAHPIRVDPVDIHPADDVEMIWPPGPLRRGQLEAIFERLDALEPLGETPLYLAIRQAVDALQQHAESAPGTHPARQIVVITDGINEQSPGGATGLTYKKDVSDALKTPATADIQLNVLGFFMGPNEVAHDQQRNPNALQAFRDLNDLAVENHGAFHNVRDPSTLLAALERSLHLSQYVIQRAKDQELVTPGPVDLNKPWPINQAPGTKVPYVVKLSDPERQAQAEIVLEGGEAIDLYLSEDRHALEHRRYDKGLRDYRDRLADPLDPTRQFFVGAHVTAWQGDDLRFLLSIQNNDPRKFSPRPAEAWVQIRPLLPGGPGPAYVFFDPQFEPGLPVPVLRCVAAGWPPAANQAEIRLWFSMAKTPADPVLTLDDFQRKGVLSVPGAPGVSFEWEPIKRDPSGGPLKVAVVERHKLGSDLAEVETSVRVEMLSPPPPLKVVHRYNYGIATIRHMFFYEDNQFSTVGGLSLALTAHQRMAERAVALPEPLKIYVEKKAMLER